MDYIVLGLFVAFCVIVGFTKDQLVTLVAGCFRYNISLDTDELAGTRLARNSLFFLFLGIFTCYLSSRPFATTPLPDYLLGCDRSLLFLFYLVCFVVFFLVRCLLMRLLGWTIDTPAFTRLIGRTGQDYCVLGGLIFLPLYFVFSFPFVEIGNVLNTCLMVLLIVGYFLYLVRTLQIFLSAHFSLFFWILYLCTLEIVPFGVLFYFVAR